MKVALIHCYSDFNKGDLGIILGTINALTEVKPDLEINAISTFEINDPKFSTDHHLLKSHVKTVYPSVLGRVFSNKGKIGLAWKVLKDVPKMISIYSGLFRVAPKLLLGKSGAESFRIIEEADLVISKGGSFICNERGLINQMRFFRLMSTFWLCFKAGKEVSILGQSLGPLYGNYCRKFTNRLLNKCNHVVIRETTCLEAYPYIQKGQNFVIGNDMAFSLQLGNIEMPKPYEGYVGFTIKRFSDKVIDDNYSDTLKKSMEYLVKELGKKVVIVPHVTIDDDFQKGKEVYDLLDTSTKENVLVLNNDYDANELLDLYGQLSLMVGTRLHSTIFATVAGTPAINISYHGTKSRGVFSGLEINDLVLEGNDINYFNLKTKIDEILSGTRDFDQVQERLMTIKADNLKMVKTILS
ncbi:polysaccharide pyruvyl transferase family protein [Roseivirga sp. E12]|uniref:polysaccharide pyruvyl transferase family protein n=1 Tax=Roseivirga sp. E12 TaxID=2819237 RepID=UPI001ABD3EF7|nr:polysaccharide pyruvyl transferase family protein [Roseivirga sp. E12]MBO3700883.1 polysaccharide pyruvyl transferase family protein [Roseivirga sp. E12]